MHTYHVWGIRRSGNHAVIGWILQGVGAPYVHFNDVQDPRDPVLSPAGVGFAGMPAWRYKRGLLRKIKYRLLAGDEVFFAGSDDSVNYRALASNPALRCRVFSYEDKPLIDAEEWRNRSDERGSLRGLTSAVLVLRDPFNLFASLLKSGFFSGHIEVLPDLYERHAQAYLDQERAGVVGVNYNQWVQDPSYRIAIARKLRFDTDGAAYESVPHNGGGSSFSGRAYHENATAMNVLERWRSMAANEEYRRLILSPNVRASALRIFPSLARDVYAAVS